MIPETAYPLTWPIGWPRTPRERRKDGRFHRRDMGHLYRIKNDVTVSGAVGRIMEELGRFTRVGRPHRVRMDEIVISTNLALRNDGLPRSGQRAPEDPGVAVYFTLDGAPQCIPCDHYTTVEQNLAAVAATIEALRTLERHGSGIMKRAFTGFQALPHLAEDPWWIVLGVPDDAPLDVIEKRYLKLRSLYHPDHGGSAEQFSRTQKAWEQAQEARQ